MGTDGTYSAIHLTCLVWFVMIRNFRERETSRLSPISLLYFGMGWWWINGSPGEIAHEFGRLLNLSDQYIDTPLGSVPKLGFENDIMSGASGFVHEDTLNRVLAGRACGRNK